MHRVETNSFVRVKPIIEYLNEHRLKTKKQISASLAKQPRT